MLFKLATSTLVLFFRSPRICVGCAVGIGVDLALPPYRRRNRVVRTRLPLLLDKKRKQGGKFLKIFNQRFVAFDQTVAASCITWPVIACRGVVSFDEKGVWRVHEVAESHEIAPDLIQIYVAERGGGGDLLRFFTYDLDQLKFLLCHKDRMNFVIGEILRAQR